MKRKVSLHGPSTLTVSLPSSWVKKYGIKKGDEVEVEEKNKGLLVTTQKGLEFNKKEIDISELHPLVNRTIMKIYQDGYDEVRVNFEQPELIKRVQDVLGQLIGFEIIEHGRNYCLIKDISGSSGHDFPMVFRRMFLLMKGIFEDGQKALEEENKGAVQNLIYRDLELNKITNFCLRVLNKKNLECAEEVPYFTIIHLCEKIGDEYKGLLKDGLEKKIKADGDFLSQHKRMMEFFNEVYNFTFEKSQARALKIAREYEKIRKENSIFRNIFDLTVFIQELQLSKIKDI